MRLLNRFSWLTAVMFGGSVAGLVGACVLTNENHCALNLGACSGELVCDKCAIANDGCVSPDQLTNETCLVGNSDTATETTTTQTTTMTTQTTQTTSFTTTVEPTSEPPTTTTESTTTMGATETTMEPTATTMDPTTGIMCDPGEPANADCFQQNPSKPFCVEMDVCGSCSELVGISCADIDAKNPACHPENGNCVECTEDNLMECGVADVCNQYTNDCGKCFEHAQCSSGACNLNNGACFPESKVVWVENRNNCNGENGTESKPWCEIQVAIENGMGDDRVLMLKQGEKPHDGTIVIGNGITVAMIGVDDENMNRVKISSADKTDNRITVTGNSKLFISNVDLVSSPKSPIFIDCSGSILKLDQVRFSGNKTPLSTATCDVLLDRTMITDNTAGSLISGAKLTMKNSFVTDNAGDFGPFRITANVEINHSTIVNNQGATTSGFVCTDDNLPFKVRNSVFLGQPPPIVGCNLMDENTFIGEPADLGALFQPPTDGLYRPRTGPDTIKTLAEWADGDPYIDYDGITRPNVVGAKDFAGAVRP